MSENNDWLEPWNELYANAISFENELNKELGEHHILYGKKVTAIGRRCDCDDFLFKIHDWEYEYAVVHLTYSMNKEVNPIYPKTKVFKDIKEWIDKCLIPDHSEYTAGED